MCPSKAITGPVEPRRASTFPSPSTITSSAPHRLNLFSIKRATRSSRRESDGIFTNSVAVLTIKSLLFSAAFLNIDD